jgi:hypothetical protein
MIARSELSVILLVKRVQYHSPVHGRPVTAIAGNDASARPGASAFYPERS